MTGLGLTFQNLLEAVNVFKRYMLEMRVIKLKSLVLILCTISLVFTNSCGNLFCFQVSGPITQWSYHISPFQKIRVYNAPQIYITQGDSQSVVVESEENMFHALLFHIDPFKKLLYVDFDETCIDDIDHFKIFITVDTLKEIDLRAGGEVWVEDTMITDTMNVFVSGDADVHLSYLKTSYMNTVIDGSGNMHYTGIDTVDLHEIDVSGIGSIFSYNLNCKRADIAVSGGALIQTSVQDTLTVDITGTADVYYKGLPFIQENITGNGQVIDAN